MARGTWLVGPDHDHVHWSIVSDNQTSLINRVGVVYARSQKIGRTTALLDSSKVSQKTALANGAPAHRACQIHPWNQVVSPPSCGHRRSGAQRRGIKKVIVREGTATITVCKVKQEPSSPTARLRVSHPGKDGNQAHVRGPGGSERPRAVAPPAGVPDARAKRRRH